MNRLFFDSTFIHISKLYYRLFSFWSSKHIWIDLFNYLSLSNDCKYLRDCLEELIETTYGCHRLFSAYLHKLFRITAAYMKTI